MKKIKETYTSKNEAVNHPQHYNQNGIEVMDCIEAWLGTQGAIDFCLGNSIKYIARANFKENSVQDLQKAKWYLDWVVAKNVVLSTQEPVDDDPDWN